MDLQCLVHERQVKADPIEGAQAVCLIELAYQFVDELVTGLVAFAEDPKVVRSALAGHNIFTTNHGNLITRCVESRCLDIEAQKLHVLLSVSNGIASINFFSEDL
jgi:hypothetical protein